MKAGFQNPNEDEVIDRVGAERTIRELTEQVARLRTLVDASFEGIGISRKGVVIEVNEQLATMLGYERDEMIGMPVIALVAPESRELVRRAIESNRAEPYEHLAIRKDGSVFPVEVRGGIMGKREDQTRVAAVRDITGRREACDQLKTLTQRFQLATAAAAIAVWDWDLSTNTAMCDERLLEIYGLPNTGNGRMTFEQWAKLVHPEDLPGQEAALQRTIREKGQGFREFRIIRPNGALRHIQSAEAVITDDRGTPIRVVGVNIDITGRKEAEGALRQSEERFRAIVDDQTDMIVRWKPDGTRTFVNQAYCRFFDKRYDELVGTSFFPLVAEQDREKLRQKVSALTPSNPVAVDVHRSLLPSGEFGWQEWSDRGIFDARGRLVELQSVGRDITERKRTDQALRESEERFRSVVEFSPIGVAVAVDERLVYVNPAAAKLAGASDSADLEKLIGRSVYDFIPAEFREQARERRLKVLQLGCPLPTIETPLLRLDGSTGIVEVLNVPLVYARQSAIMNLIRDVTERKRLEEERAQSLVREQEAQEQFTQQLISSQEAERTRLAGELHDSLGQNLLLIKNRVQQALEGTIGDARLKAHLETIRGLASQAIAEVRHISHDLHPYQLDLLGLTRSLEVMIDNATVSSYVVFEHKLDRVDDVFDSNAATNIYRVVQEGLNNVLKHSGARHARVEIERDVREVVLRIEDDGVGFAAEPKSAGGFGLRNIFQRVRLIGGKLTVGPRPERGTRLEVIIPIPEHERERVQ